jgi:uncharacterized protein (TIGR02145 family)
MLMPYLRKLDTASVSDRINLKVNIADTAGMLTPYLRKLDTASVSNRINLKVNIADTAGMLMPYLRDADTTNMLVPYLRDADTTNMLVPYLRDADTTNMLVPYLRDADTTNMLVPYLRDADTTNMLVPYLRDADTTSMLIPYLRDADTTSMLANYRLALNEKAPINNPIFTGTVSGINKTMVGLGNVDNTSDAGKPVSSATQTALNLKANLASPTFSGTVSGITKEMVGLANVDNTSDLNKPISTATQAALDSKLGLPAGSSAGNMLYWNGSSWVIIPPGTTGQSLVFISNVPTWVNTVPGPPTNIAAVAGNNQATVTFNAPSSNGGSSISHYTVASSPGYITATANSTSIIVTGLTNGTSYTFTVVARNTVGNSTSSAASNAVTPAFTCGTNIADTDGNTYPTVLIGTQCWTASNLKVTRYNDGTAIPLNNTYTSGTVSTVWQGLTTGAYTIYNNESSTGANATNYGFLYNWYAAAGIITNGGSPTKNICPTGWHVPTDTEWTTLTGYIGGTSVAGGKMKSIGTTYWNSPNNGADNSSGFSALPGGVRSNDGSFLYVRNYTYFWSATEAGSNAAWFRNLYHNDGNVGTSNEFKSSGASVRCLKD